MTNQIQIKCNISFKDYMSYCMYPIKRKKVWKFFMVFSFICFALASLLLVVNIVNHTLTYKVYFPVIIIVVVYAFIILSTLLSQKNRYKKSKKSFQNYLVYSFLNNKMTIATPDNLDDTMNIFIEKIYCIEETKNKVFITLTNAKYYMVDKNSFISGSITDLREWANKHIKLIKMAGFKK